MSSTAHGRPGRGRAVSGRVSLWLRRAEGIARAGDAARRRPRRRLRASRRRHREDEAGGAAGAEGARAVPVSRTAASPTGRASAGGRRPTSPATCCTSSRSPATSKYDVDRSMQQRALCLPGSRAGAAAADQRELVARLHRLAGIRGQGDGRGRPQPGLAPHAPLRLPRSDAGLRAGVPARRAGRQGREERSRGSPSCGGG